MKNVSIYKLSMGNALWIIDINMNDDINSHRYYFIDSNYQMTRVKSIDNFLGFLDKKGIELIEIDDNEIYNLYKNIMYYKNAEKTSFNSYPGLTPMNDYDTNVISHKIFSHYLNNKIQEKIKSEDKKER